ncbi:FtsX-like permease family protein [Candidatus Saccharibacteria bacterium]|nr:FtsX-like permease family protein [Candidatus Saccharibacteria bacterium]
MSMPLGFSVKVSLFSMRKRLIRTILSLIPAVILIAIMFVGSTIPNGLVNELDEQVLKKVETRQEIVALDEYLFNQPGIGAAMGSSGMPEFEFNEAAFKTAVNSPLIKEVYEQFGAISGQADNIGNVKNPSLGLKGMSAEFSKLYSGKPFEYRAGEPIPIILNPRSVSVQSYNFGNKTTMELDYSNEKDTASKLAYTELRKPETVVGQTFTMEFGKFPAYPEAFEEQQQTSGFAPPKSKIIKLTTNDQTILDKRVNEIYSPYWRVEELRKPTSLQFVVIGLTNGEDPNAGGYIPNNAVIAIWNSLYQKQLGARTTKPLDKEFLSKEANKISVKQGKLSVQPFLSGGPSTWTKESPEISTWEIQLQNIGVPALLVATSKNARGETEYSEAAKQDIDKDSFVATSAIVKLHSADDREAYLAYLKTNNLEVFDNSPLAMIRSIRSGANTFVTWLTIILGAIVALILMTTVSRFVADSRREIGVWRAIGATRTDITKLVLTRSSVLLVIGVGIGALIGLGTSVWLASEIAQQISSATSGFNPYANQGFVGSLIVSLMGGEVPALDAANLVRPDWRLLFSRLGLLAGITLLISTIPAWRASRISPVTAIRDSDA